MPEITLADGIARIFEQFGLSGLVAILITYLIWQDRQRTKKDAADYLERQKNAEADRTVWTNHLSEMITRDSVSRESLAVGLTKLAESVSNFQSKCSLIQGALQNEVDRMMKG